MSTPDSTSRENPAGQLGGIQPPGVLRLCAPLTSLPVEQCSIPGRCDHTRRCDWCGALVHYDPDAAIPVLGPETLACLDCAEKAL